MEIEHNETIDSNIDFEKEFDDEVGVLAGILARYEMVKPALASLKMKCVKAGFAADYTEAGLQERLTQRIRYNFFRDLEKQVLRAEKLNNKKETR